MVANVGRDVQRPGGRMRWKHLQGLMGSVGKTWRKIRMTGRVGSRLSREAARSAATNESGLDGVVSGLLAPMSRLAPLAFEGPDFLDKGAFSVQRSAFSVQPVLQLSSLVLGSFLA